MTSLPQFMWLSGDDNSAVWLICDHPDHAQDRRQGVAHYGGWGESDANGLPHFETRRLSEFIAFAADHAEGHRSR